MECYFAETQALAWEIGTDVGLRYWTWTPAEFALIAEGYLRRQEQEWHRTAWLACYLLAPWTKTRVTPEKLLGRSLRRPPRTVPVEE